MVKSEKRDSNPRPRPWQGRALPTELFSHLFIRTCQYYYLRWQIYVHLLDITTQNLKKLKDFFKGLICYKLANQY